MANYFRITAYNPNEDVGMIVDSNGRHEKLWQFSAELVAKGFKIFAVGNETKFTEGNISKTGESDKLLLRACTKACPYKTAHSSRSAANRIRY